MKLRASVLACVTPALEPSGAKKGALGPLS